MKTPEEIASWEVSAWLKETDRVFENMPYSDAHYALLRKIFAAAIQAERGAQARRIAELEKALEPFASLADVYLFDDTEITHFQGRPNLKVGHCRRAAEVLGRGRG